MTVDALVEPATALILEGPFVMGNDAHLPDERPAHRVWLCAFRLALLPVTNREYAAFLDATGHEPPRFWLDDRFNAPAQPGVYPYVCTVSGHFSLMQGRLVVTP